MDKAPGVDGVDVVARDDIEKAPGGVEAFIAAIAGDAASAARAGDDDDANFSSTVSRADFDDTAAETTSVAAEMTSVPAEMISVAAEMTSVPAEMTSVAAEMISVAAEMISVAAEMTSVAAEMTSVPAETISVAAETTSVPAEMLFASAEGAIPIVDRASSTSRVRFLVLSPIRAWLGTPVVEQQRDDHGRPKGPPRYTRPTAGTPQGGAISPLLGLRDIQRPKADPPALQGRP